jgi:predicted ArsR family transcriptional regulator
MQPKTIKLTDPRAIRAYAHPTRMRLVGLLRREGPLTATRAAEILGESSGTTSFHLRQLAKYGLVEEAGGGTGREKPWRATALFTNLPSVVEPGGIEASIAVRSALATLYHQNLLDWISRAPDEPAEWQRASELSDLMLYLTVEELAELTDSIQSQLERYSERLVDPSLRPAGARLVTYLNIAFPGRPDDSIEAT